MLRVSTIFKPAPGPVEDGQTTKQTYGSESSAFREPAKSFDLKSVHKPVNVCLNILGLNIKRGRSDSGNADPKWRTTFKNFGIGNWILFLFAHVYIIHLAATTVMFTFKHVSILELSGGVQKVLKVLVSVLSVDHYFLRQNNIRVLLASSWSYIRGLDGQTLTRFRRQYRLLAVGIVLNFVIGFATLPRALHNMPEYLDKSLYGFNATSKDSSLTTVILDYAVFVFMDGLSIVMMYVFMGVCLHLSYSVRFYLNALQAASAEGPVRIQELYRLQRYHTEISELCQNADGVFSRVALTWYFDLVQRFLLLVPALLTAVKKEPLSVHFGLLVNFGYFSYLFIVVSLSASAIGEISRQGVLAVHEIAQRVATSDWQAVNLVTNLVHLVCTSRMYLTGWNFFIIDRSLILTVCSLILTYTVVVLQFYSPQ